MCGVGNVKREIKTTDDEMENFHNLQLNFTVNMDAAPLLVSYIDKVLQKVIKGPIIVDGKVSSDNMKRPK